MIRYINLGQQEVPILIDKVEETYKSRYIADLCVKNKIDNYFDQPLAVFWNPIAHSKGSNYFGLYFDAGTLFICNAIQVTEGVWNGMEAENGEIIFSRFRHDYRTSRDGTVMVDGGRDYFKCSGNKQVQLKIVGPIFTIV